MRCKFTFIYPEYGLAITLISVFCALCAPTVLAGDSTNQLTDVGDRDKTESFLKRLKNDHILTLPAGRYLIHSLTLPENSAIVGTGADSVLVLAVGATISCSNGSVIASLRLESQDRYDASKMRVSDESKSALLIRNADSAMIDNVTIEDYRFTAIRMDHASNTTVRNCMFKNVNWAVDILFSRNIWITDNKVYNARSHGIQFWGNWQWKSKSCSDIVIKGNYVKNGGRGAIWGSGGKRILIIGNIIDGAKDVGADLEWCDDSVIANNSIARCDNACIALFFACARIAITGNVVANNAPLPKKKRDAILKIMTDKKLTMDEKMAKIPWFVRSGIWLTPPNRQTFKLDKGHSDVSIVGNVINTIDDGIPRRDMWIGSEVGNVKIESNVLSGKGIFYGGHHTVSPLRLERLEKQPILLNKRPTPDKPKF